MQIENFCEVHYLPLDVLAKKSVEQRLIALRAASGVEDSNELHAEWAETWPVVGARENKFSSYYDEGNVDKLSKLNGWDALVRSEAALRPWLEERGYKDLVWWTDEILKFN
jgi:hypothetical protein